MPGEAAKAQEIGKHRIAKIDEDLGIVYGWAIICKVDGEDYFDLNIDKNADGTFERVPENIPEPVMVKASAEFMALANRPGNEMHKGDESGSFIFAFPMTTEVYKNALGIDNPHITGLLVGYKATPEVLAKFKSGEYTGFSIEGHVFAAEEIVDA